MITVYLDAGEIPDDIVDRIPQSSRGGFNAIVQDWQNKMNAEVTI